MSDIYGVLSDNFGEIGDIFVVIWDNSGEMSDNHGVMGVIFMVSWATFLESPLFLEIIYGLMGDIFVLWATFMV